MYGASVLKLMRRLALALTVIVLAVACGDDSDTNGAGGLTDWISTTTADDTTTTEDTSPAPVTTTTWPDRSSTHDREELSPPDIEILDHGAEPRSALRLNLSAGDSQRVVVDIMQARQMHVEGVGSGDEAEASYAIDIDMVVTAVDEGMASIETTYVDVRLLDPGAATEEDIAEFRAIADSVAGMTFYSTFDDRGITHMVDSPRSFGGLDSPDDVAVAGLSVPEIPLPAEAVGLGARWRSVIGPMSENGTMTTITTEYELQEIHDDRLVINQVSTTTTEPMSVEGWHYGASESTIEGILTWHLADLIPVGVLEGTAIYPFTSVVYGPDNPGEIWVRNRTTTSVTR